MLSVDSIKEMANGGKGAANIKYVRLEHGFRYAVAGGPVEHYQLVQKGEKPISAGFFSLYNDFFFMHKMPSTSLQLGPLDEDANLLKTIFLQ